MAAKRAVLLAGLAAVSLGAPAKAQEDPRLSAIEAQIRALQTELTRVRRDLAASSSELRAARQARRAPAPSVAAAPAPAPAAGGVQQASAPPPPAVSDSASPKTSLPGGVSFPQGRPTLATSDGRASFAVGLQFNYDIGGVFQGSRDRPDLRQFPRLNTFGENLRRARLPFVFKYDDFQVNLTPDFGGSPDGSPTLYEASLNWNAG